MRLSDEFNQEKDFEIWISANEAGVIQNLRKASIFF